MFGNNNRLDTVELYLEHFLINENDTSSTLKLRKLDESQKSDLSKEMINAMTRMTIKKSRMCDYDLVEQSKGDISKFTGYGNMKQTLSALRVLSAKYNSNLSEISSIELAIKNLEDNKAYFMTAFRTNNEIVKLMYNNIVIACVCSTSFLIANIIDFTKDITGEIVLTSKMLRTKSAYPTLYFKNIDVFNNKVSSGELVRFLNSMEKKEQLALSTAMVTTGLIVLIFGFIPLIREITYQYYHSRVSLSNYLRMQSDFLLMNQKNLDPKSDAYRKQNEIANRLLAMADSIDVDSKSTSKRAEIELKKENTSMTLTSPDISDSILI